MILDASPTSARLGSRVRFGLLSVVALLIGHNAVYAARFGVGDQLRTAMTSLGHDGYWGPFSLVAIAAATVLIVGTVLTIERLRQGLTPATGRSAPTASGASYRRELSVLWPRLFLAVVILFALQENVEAWLAMGQVPGIDVLLGAGMPLGIAVLGIVTVALAAIGALVRWRIAVLARRLSEAARAVRAYPTTDGPAREWAHIDALAPHRWIADRLDAGRAPPMLLPA